MSGYRLGRRGPLVAVFIVAFVTLVGYVIFPEGATCRGSRPGYESPEK